RARAWLARRVIRHRPSPHAPGAPRARQRLDHLVGQLGGALTPLRPSGLVDFDGRRLDGLSEEGLIPSGALIRAIRVRGGQLIVRTAPEADHREINPDLAPTIPRLS